MALIFVNALPSAGVPLADNRFTTLCTTPQDSAGHCKFDLIKVCIASVVFLTIMVQVSKALAGTRAALSPQALLKLQAQVQAMVRCLNCPGGPWYEQQPPKFDRTGQR